MQVILLENIKGIGQVGDIKEVADGYARNFLLPRRLARSANVGAIKDVEAVKVKKMAALDLAKDEAKAIAEKIEGTTVEMSAKANEKGTLFAAIEPADIAKELSKLAGAKVEESAIELDEHIKTVGDHEVRLELVDGVTVTVILKVSAA